MMGEAIGRVLIPPIKAQAESLARIEGQSQRALHSFELSCAPGMDVWAEARGDCTDSRAWQRWEQPPGDAVGWEEKEIRKSRGPSRSINPGGVAADFYFTGIQKQDVDQLRAQGHSVEPTEHELQMSAVVAQNGRPIRWVHEGMSGNGPDKR